MNSQEQQLINTAKAVIFDLDGVIIDSIPLFRKSRDIFLGKHGIVYDPQKQPSLLGMGIKDIFRVYQERLGLTGDIGDLTNEWRKEYYALLLAPGNLKLLEGAEAVIKNLYGHKPLAIATGGHEKEKAGQLLEVFDLKKYFQEIISSESDHIAQGKPYPDVYLFTSQKLGIDPKDCLVIEDAPNGTIAAKRAGMKVIGVNKDPELRKKLQEAGADAVVKSLGEIKQI